MFPYGTPGRNPTHCQQVTLSATAVGAILSAMTSAPDYDDHSTAIESTDHTQAQSRTIKVLMTSQVFGGMGLVAGYIPAALLAKEITGNATLAGLAAAMLSVGTTGASFPLAGYMYRTGRRPGLRIGYLVAATGAAAGITAAILSLYPLLLVAVALIGVGNACNLAARYAAADLATEATRGRSIGVIVWATTIGSASGSYVALAGATAVAASLTLPSLAGPYALSLAVFLVAAFVVHTRLRPDPLVLAGGLQSDADTHNSSRWAELSRATRLIIGNTNALIAVGALITSQVVMVGVMTMTPLHMDDGGQSEATIGFMMTLHILGMYAFSPIIGYLSDRLGRLPMIGLAAIILLLGAEFAAHTPAPEPGGVMLGNFLIGLGWGFGVIAGSTLLTESFTVSDRVAVQGAADLAMSGFGAAGGLLSGTIVSLRSYGELGHYAASFSALLLLTVAWQLFTGRRRQRRTTGDLQHIGAN